MLKRTFSIRNPGASPSARLFDNCASFKASCVLARRSSAKMSMGNTGRGGFGIFVMMVTSSTLLGKPTCASSCSNIFMRVHGQSRKISLRAEVHNPNKGATMFATVLGIATDRNISSTLVVSAISSTAAWVDSEGQSKTQLVHYKCDAGFRGA